jgi:hypothetical protein
MQNAERNLNYALLLKSCLDIIPELETILATGIQPFFVRMRKVHVFLELESIYVTNKRLIRVLMFDALIISQFRSYIDMIDNMRIKLIEFKKFRVSSHEG